MQTTIATFEGVPFTLSLERDPVKNKYVVTYASQSRLDNRLIIDTFDNYEDAWDKYRRSVHYYNNIVLEPLTEEQFLGLPKGFLYKKGVIYA
jgi:hypothetical protein